jgi:hypothetical protein
LNDVVFFSVSNFSVRNLETLLAEAKVVPAVNQASFQNDRDIDRSFDNKTYRFTGRSTSILASAGPGQALPRKGDPHDRLLA